VADRLEDDERCARLEKIDRLDIFQVCFVYAHLFICVLVEMLRRIF
jgi:hypothetical protein